MIRCSHCWCTFVALEYMTNAMKGVGEDGQHGPSCWMQTMNTDLSASLLSDDPFKAAGWWPIGWCWWLKSDTLHSRVAARWDQLYLVKLRHFGADVNNRDCSEQPPPLDVYSLPSFGRAADASRGVTDTRYRQIPALDFVSQDPVFNLSDFLGDWSVADYRPQIGVWRQNKWLRKSTCWKRMDFYAFRKECICPQQKYFSTAF